MGGDPAVGLAAVGLLGVRRDVRLGDLLGGGADHDVIAVAHRQAEQLVAHRSADDVRLHGRGVSGATLHDEHYEMTLDDPQADVFLRT